MCNTIGRRGLKPAIAEATSRIALRNFRAAVMMFDFCPSHLSLALFTRNFAISSTSDRHADTALFLAENGWLS